MSGQNLLLLGAVQQIISDPYFEYTTLLLPGNGTNGAQNNTFLDGSTNNFTITRNGNTTQGTFSPFSQTGWGNYFDGTGDYLTTPSNAALAFGSSDFTLEFWIYITAHGGTDGRPLGNHNGWGANAWSLHSDHGTQNEKFSFWVNNYNASVAMLVSTTTATLNTWFHVAVTRSGNSWKMFINGTQEGGTVTSSVALDGGSSDDMYIGGSGSANEYVTGYMSSVRALKGTALYTSNFTPPTTPLTAITNTSLLTCQSNRFIDNSTNAFAITRNGDVSVQAFSPFNPTASWSAATNGGSGYFDGSGDYLSVADNTALDISGQFTWECWVYFSSISGSSDNILYSKLIVTPSVTGLEIGVNTTGKFYVWINGSVVITSTSSVSAGQWVHLAASRDGSNNVRIFINGTSAATAVSNSADTSTSASVILGANYAGSARVTGYISNFRLVKGTAVYTANFTPPTSPLTAITNTSLLCNFTNAGIYDATSKNDLETVGNAQISTTQSKFGGSSMYFDGTGDWLLAPSRATTSLEGDFTIEGWAYLSSTAAAWPVITIGDSNTSTGIELYRATSTGKWRVYNNNTSQIESATSTSTGSWVHLAIARYNGVVRLYINGINEGSTWSTTGTFSGAVYVAAEFFGGSVTVAANGYLQDVRITKGVARYTSTFTPPAAAFPVL